MSEIYSYFPTWTDRWRKWRNHFMLGVIYVLGILSVIPLVFIAGYVFVKGIAVIDWSFLTLLPAPPPGNEPGGIANALIGSFIVVGIASLAAIPWGVGLGVFMNEYEHTLTAKILGFVVDLLISAPSIVIGIFIYGLVVSRFGFSAYAGAGSLLLIMMPFIVKGTQEILRMVPHHIREAGLALGLSRWKVIVYILLRSSLAMVITIIMLSVARVAGETAPLLFTALGSHYHMQSLREPIATLPVQIYELFRSGFQSMEEQAWGGALVLVVFVFSINLFTRLGFFVLKKIRAG